MSGKTLLFADDSATMRQIMEKTFLGEPFDVITVPSGQAAIEKAKDIRPDIIIADAGMAGINGYDVCEAIRKDGALSGTPLVIMSGISNPYDEAKGAAVGATEHIKKPFDTAKLLERVLELCGGGMPAAATAPAAAPSLPKPAMPLPAPTPAAAPVRPERPSSGPTLHAFPKPAGIGDAPPAAVPPRRPDAPLPLTNPFGAKPGPRATADMRMPSREPEPIELEPVADEENGAIQVGTLAELAQMDAGGGTVPQEHRDDAIELDAAPAPRPAPMPLPPASAPKSPMAAPAAVQAVRAAGAEAAARVVSRVPGLTDEQATAILALTEDVIEKVVWEVVPDLAETIIREKIEKLLSA